MQYQLFINSIINRKCGNVRPFSPVFNASDLKVVKDKVLKGAVPDPEFEKMYEAFEEVSKLMKFAYDDLYAKQNQVLEEMKTPAFDVYSHLIAIANHNYGFIYEKLNSLLENKKGSIQLFSVLSAAKIESIDKKVGLLHLDGALEGQIDSLTMLINYLRYFRTSRNQSSPLPDDAYIEGLHRLYLHANALSVLKNDFDDSILNDGFITIDKECKNITFDYFCHDHLKMLSAGSNILNLKSLHEYKKNLMPNLFMGCFQKKRIKRMTTTMGMVNLKFEYGKNVYLEDKAREFCGAIVSYYGYLHNEFLPNLPHVSIIEALSVWIILQGLADYICKNVHYNIEIKTKKDLNRLPCRISKKVLLHYVNVNSRLSREQIKSVLDIFTSTPDKFCDLWNAPLYDCGEYYSFPLFPISQGMSFNIIDWVIYKGGISLEKRGPLFEKFIVNEMKGEHLRGYMRKIYGSKVYERNKGDYQEIDCIVELKELVVVAELKCIQYPMNPQNHHDCRKRLMQGCEQAHRKAQYVRDNPKLFSKVSASIPGKKVLPVVVTNYPNYLGYSHVGVYVVDSHSFVSYMNTGRMTVSLASKEEGSKVIGQAFLYQNESEFASNFEDFLRNNPIVSILKEKIEIKEMVHPEVYGYKINVVYASPENSDAPMLRNGINN